MTDTLDTAVRFADRKDGIIEGLIVPFFGPIEGDKDLLGTRFSATTDFAMDWFPEGGRPGLYAHGFDDDIQLEVIGRELAGTRMTDKGLWMKAQLDKAHRFADEIMQLVDEGALTFSSGTIDHLMRVNRATRDVERWPWVEWSLVPNPGNPEARIYSVRSTDALAHAPEVAVRIVESLDALVPTAPEPVAEATPNIETVSTPDVVDSVRSLLTAVDPEALHALAVERGATCTRDAEPEPQPEPMVTIVSPAESVRQLTDEDIAEMRDFAIEQARLLIT